MATGFQPTASGIPWIAKDPTDKLDYVLDWGADGDSYLDGDTITGTPVWVVPSGLVLEAQSNTTTTTTAWLSGGTAGTTYRVACKITTAGGRIAERSFDLRVQDR